MLKWTTVNDGITNKRFWSAHRKLSIAACYTPTNKVAEIENEYSYETLKSIVAKIPRQNITCVVGDLNVKTPSGCKCTDVTDTRRAMLKWTPVDERITNTRFQSARRKLSIAACYTPTNKVAEIENDNSYETLKSVVAKIRRHNITCVVGDLNVKWRKILIDVRSNRGTDIQSDHCLMVGKIHLKVKVTQKRNELTIHKHFNVEKLKDKETTRMLKLELSNRFEALQ
ncbi:hypothetical protein QYM36_019233 [Artemia franciscana]|uniref:Endonuclease/exonuclease/phosphatase domain-containing protein n=1 Tax=Artemia franciscana TaxID=6661 RepID=A0AA88H2K4_ARTSF|nr:hypothetical protein QYM36_019233 [Artemia franciscana]